MVAIGIVAATVAAVLLSAGFYAVAPSPAAGPGHGGEPEPPVAVQVGVELLRSGAVAGLVAGLLLAGGWSGAADGAVLGLALWTLPVVLLAGSVVHESTRASTAAVHAGDWLLKLAAVGAIMGLFT